ncbi:MAG: bifunctional adenosylcobinamide kinase/adenosylcobinamide-phosphate guanylyltransferase [Candidatus Omnitrophica bacterium]|nr:bifunctional adenosylcobinamide kinase/adenosylcobinamide-phosphate guanylyltransferase [Candidatus Omnitrophota bacterium]
MGKITFIIGGARSGKSSKAIALAKEKAASVAFIATCEALDKEMSRRIAAHKRSRPAGWKTFECPRDISLALKKAGNKFEVIIIDCLTLWVSNLLLERTKEKLIEGKTKRIIAALKKIKGGSIIVSNEVGLGIVPGNELGRAFRDIAGRVNQIVAQGADEVFFMAAGLVVKLK